jgi:A-macroglobulin complement component.
MYQLSHVVKKQNWLFYKKYVLCSRYLEHQLSSMTDPYEIAITTYVLTLCNSNEKEFAFSRLHSTRLEVAGTIIYVTKMQTSLLTHLARCYLCGNFIASLTWHIKQVI